MRRGKPSDQPGWDEIREKHSLFWKCDPAVGPLEGVKRTSAFTLGDLKLGGADGHVEPGDIELGEVTAWAERLFGKGKGFLDGELVWGAPPLPGMPWMEALLGASVRASGDGASLWPEKWVGDWGEFMRFEFDPDRSAWYGRLAQIIRALKEHIGGRYPMTQALMQGPSDILAALRGMDRFCLDFIDQPDQLKAAIERTATIWIDLARDQFELIPAFDGGYPAPRLEVWAPGRLIRIEEDATVLIGPELFRDFFLEADRRIFAAFDYSLIHLHSVNHKILPLLAGLTELSGLQVLIDPMGPPLEEMIGPLKAVQDAGKPLLITHELCDADLNLLKRRLAPRGLALERMIA
jgi:hypothetical protein